MLNNPKLSTDSSNGYSSCEIVLLLNTKLNRLVARSVCRASYQSGPLKWIHPGGKDETLILLKKRESCMNGRGTSW